MARLLAGDVPLPQFGQGFDGAAVTGRQPFAEVALHA
jgi:hypothetical protein